MSNSTSQEHTIYRSLSGQIQLGFFDDGERFPSAQEIARHYHVSYCPAQRALKMLEKDGLVKLCRGKETVVLAKPYSNYLESRVFQERSLSLADLSQTLKLISPDICAQGIRSMNSKDVCCHDGNTFTPEYQGKRLYRVFDKTLQALGSRTVLSLYYDIGSFVESAYLDILKTLHGDAPVCLFLQEQADTLLKSIPQSQSKIGSAAIQMQEIGNRFFAEIQQYLNELSPPAAEEQLSFSWEPRKGRTRYCDVIAIDLACKISQGTYKTGTLLPGIEILGNMYHVSPITIRRTISLLNKLEAVKTINGVGTKVISAHSNELPFKLKELMLDDSLLTCLEALQLLAVTCKSVIEFTFEHFMEAVHEDLLMALSSDNPFLSIVSTISACLQAIIHCCPLLSIREIYSKITLLLLEGSLLRIHGSCRAPLVRWQSICEELLTGLNSCDKNRFAAAFQTLILENFTAVKQNLSEIGIAEAANITDPVFP